MFRFDVLSPMRTRLSARLDGAGDAVEHRRADGSLEVAHEIGHARTAEHDRLRAVFKKRPLDLGFDRAARVGAWLFQPKHRHVRRAHAGAARRKPVFGEIAFDRRDRAGKRGDDAKLFGDEARHMERRLADPNDRRLGRGARGLEAGVVETGDDESVGVLRLGDLRQEAGNGKGLVEIAFDAWRAELRIDRADLDSGRRGGFRSIADLRRHRGGGVGVDDVDPHHFDAR